MSQLLPWSETGLVWPGSCSSSFINCWFYKLLTMRAESSPNAFHSCQHITSYLTISPSRVETLKSFRRWVLSQSGYLWLRWVILSSLLSTLQPQCTIKVSRCLVLGCHGTIWGWVSCKGELRQQYNTQSLETNRIGAKIITSLSYFHYEICRANSEAAYQNRWWCLGWFESGFVGHGTRMRVELSGL